jgi:AcrR family transcriptional regulator
MAMRSYSQQRRKDSAAETRRRLVEATAALHNEQGIAATSMKQIARRAGVSIGAAYHHFPTYDEAIRACGAHTFAAHPLPHPSSFRGVESLAERIALLARALFALYRAVPAMESAYADRRRFPALDAAMAQLDRGIETLLRAALAPQALHEGARPAVLALLHDSFYRRLAAAGLDLETAAAEAARLIVARLATDPPTAKGRP